MKNLIKIIFVIIFGLAANFSLAEAAQDAGSSALRDVSLSKLMLKGTLFTQSPNPLAVIEDAESGQIVMYELGDNISGLKIAYIRRGEVILSSLEGDYRLSFPDGGVYQPEAYPAGKNDKWYHITRQGDTITTDRETVLGAISRVRNIISKVRIRPYSADGKRCGIAITRLNEEGILKEIGIKQGDVIRTVNELTLNSPYQIFNAYRKLKDKDELRVEILRRNRPLTLTYRVEK